MALDTKEKRANVPGVGRPWMRDKFPVATPDEQWRMASGLTYGGNPLSATVPYRATLVHANVMGSIQSHADTAGTRRRLDRQYANVAGSTHKQGQSQGS